MKPTYEELEQERNELAAPAVRLRIVMTDEVAEFIRSGIGANYGGVFYGEALKRHYDPGVSVLAETLPAAISSLKAQWQADRIGAGIYDITFEEVRYIHLIGQATNVIGGEAVANDAHDFAIHWVRQRAQEAGDEL